MIEPGTYRCPACGQVIVIYLPVLALSCGRSHVKAQRMEKVEKVGAER